MKIRVYGKWILAGEHAVLRGSPALVFPMRGKRLDVEFSESSEPLEVLFSGANGDELRLLFWGVLEKAFTAKNIDRSLATGRFLLDNTLPIGAGLGASAALCVAIGRWFAWKGWAQESELYDFARGLEDLFHGESSGVDVAVALSGQGIRFVRGGERVPLAPSWQPQWRLSYSGRRGVTSECVARVKRLFETDRDVAEALDVRMRSAVEVAERALRSPGEAQGLPLLVQAIAQARGCFEDWGLAGGQMGEHLAALEAAGAIAVKPTGSGDGGFALSLWREAPAPAISESLGLVDVG